MKSIFYKIDFILLYNTLTTQNQTMSHTDSTTAPSRPSSPTSLLDVVTPVNDPSLFDQVSNGLADTARAQTDSGGSPVYHPEGGAGEGSGTGEIVNQNGDVEEGENDAGNDAGNDFRYLIHSVEKDTNIMRYYSSGEKIKFTKDEVVMLESHAASMLLLLRVDDPIENDEVDIKHMSELRQKYVEAADAHNKMICRIVDGAYYDSGFDLFVPHKQRMSGLGKKINHRVRCAAYSDNFTAIGFPVYPRSSISKTPLRLANNVGIIDSGYRGNILGAFDCFSDAAAEYTVQEGQRLLQICASNLTPFIVKVVDELDDTSRGSGGFGSTGV